MFWAILTTIAFALAALAIKQARNIALLPFAGRAS